MARIDALSLSIGRYLRKSETLVAACRATVRGGAMTGAGIAGPGAAIGYLVSTTIGDGALYAAAGGGIGAAVGITIASVISSYRMRKNLGIRAATVTLAFTGKRLLIFRQSWLSNRAVELVKELAVSDIASIDVGPSRFLSPHPVTITLDDGTLMNMESPKVEKPALLAEAFEKAG